MLALSGKPYNYQLCLRSPSLPLSEPNRETHSSNDGLGEMKHVHVVLQILRNHIRVLLDPLTQTSASIGQVSPSTKQITQILQK